jgi:hypothetical protein
MGFHGRGGAGLLYWYLMLVPQYVVDVLFRVKWYTLYNKVSAACCSQFFRPVRIQICNSEIPNAIISARILYVGINFL